MYFTLPFKVLTWTCPSSKNIPSTFLSFDPVYCLTSEGLALFIYSAFHFCSHPRLPYVTVFLIFSLDVDPSISGQIALGDPQTVYLFYFIFPVSWKLKMGFLWFVSFHLQDLGSLRVICIWFSFFFLALSKFCTNLILSAKSGGFELLFISRIAF